MYYVTKFDDEIESRFCVIPKITFANLCKPIHDITDCFTFISPFESGECREEGKKYKTLNISRRKRAF